ncbi:MAG: DUF1552 domain-containing protein [Deltaproteobacteria bacterium]|nr:DUF1552 domain-containing protein [Deltaproteobacteria bacterium]
MKPASRRLFLRGAGGVALAVPWLESLSSARAATAAQKRFVVMFQSCGIDVTSFWPKGQPGRLSKDMLLGTGLAPLAGIEDKLLVLRGLHGAPRGHGKDVNVNDHQLGTCTRLTASSVSGGLADGISLDQAIAAQINPGKRPGLAAIVGKRGQGDSMYLSFTAPRKPTPTEPNPAKIYKDFAGLSAADPAVLARITKRRESILDVVRAQFTSLQASSRLSKSDRDKLDLHFTSLREVEGQLNATCALDASTSAQLDGIDATKLAADDWFERLSRLHLDVMSLAIACGHTHVATMMFGPGAHTNTFGWLGHKQEHHLLSHRLVSFGGPVLASASTLLAQIDAWHAQQFRYLVDRLNAYIDVDGTILDNSVVLWLNELSEGKEHHYRDLPFVIAGSGGGSLKQGAYMKLSQNPDPLALGNKTLVEDAPSNKLLTTLANVMGLRTPGGAPINQFGKFGPPGEYSEIKV